MTSDRDAKLTICRHHQLAAARLFAGGLQLTERKQSRVYFAEHQDYGKVVLKLASSTAEKILLKREAEFLNRHPSPYWPKFIDYLSFAGLDWLLIHHIAAQPLAVLIRQQTCDVNWLPHAEQALKTLHRLGILHGDIKPNNILVDSNGHVTLIDFGAIQTIGAPPIAPIAFSPPFYGIDDQLTQSVTSKSDWRALALTLNASATKTKGIPGRYALLLK